ncbi:MAG: glucose-1-phosphate cytidylyltransferase [Acidobacteria bacterium RIFCSPLOWO2_12_FULL_54_10]|nr:MAG: glucose-1-phosphate cytidylyltransferase [Acidobacteria bacterium RIFCSPLOWO2_12_FULL_54_10]
MDVVILCGGMGTRLREETEYRPKPMVEIGGRPILWHIMKIYSYYGFKRFILCLGYRGHMIKQYFVNYEVLNCDFTVRIGRAEPPIIHHSHQEEDWTITLVETGEATLTGSRVKKVEPFIRSDIFMVTYGDGVADINMGELLKFHESHGRIGTVTGVRPYSRFGELVVVDGLATAFAEKPQMDEGSVNGGFFVFNRRFLDYLNADDSCVLEREPMNRLVREGELMVYSHQGFWQCMDTYRDFTSLNEIWNRGAPWKVWEE